MAAVRLVPEPTPEPVFGLSAQLKALANARLLLTFAINATVTAGHYTASTYFVALLTQHTGLSTTAASTLLLTSGFSGTVGTIVGPGEPQTCGHVPTRIHGGPEARAAEAAFTSRAVSRLRTRRTGTARLHRWESGPAGRAVPRTAQAPRAAQAPGTGAGRSARPSRHPAALAQADRSRRASTAPPAPRTAHRHSPRKARRTATHTTARAIPGATPASVTTSAGLFAASPNRLAPGRHQPERHTLDPHPPRRPARRRPDPAQIRASEK